MGIPLEIWLAIAYAIGTWVGYRIAYKRGKRDGVESSIDQLIAGGYLKTGTDENGETVIYKYWEDV